MLSKLHVILVVVLLGLLPGLDFSEGDPERGGMIGPDGSNATGSNDDPDRRGMIGPDGLVTPTSTNR